MNALATSNCLPTGGSHRIPLRKCTLNNFMVDLVQQKKGKIAHRKSDDELYETKSSCSSDSLSTDAGSENENVIGEEEEEEDSVDDVVASSVCGWKTVTSTQRSFPFTGKEELCVRPSASVDGKI
ncbi:hypothetical protein E2C01_057688 [Portunus trituberculatus]|uniref:Uncharacterized protein n=1 Tax=Portunus trituberculatus TaxID=210409 RepID=A0A5B7H114_PORTR|nr:hypothetical protein [Portunus trituberculatus]